MKKPRASLKTRLFFGHPGRMQADSRRLTLLILGSMLVFILAMIHDELVSDMVARGWIRVENTDVVEVFFGIGLFACWSILTVGMVRFLTKISTETDDERT